MSSQTQSPQARKPHGHFALVLLALAGVVAAVTIYMVVRPRSPRAMTETQSRQSQSEQVLALAVPLSEQGQYDAAVSLMQTHLRAQPDDIAVWVQLADTLMAADWPAEAEAAVDEVLRRAPRNARALWFKGLLVRRRGGEKPEYFLQQAAESPDADASIWAGYGLMLLSEGDYDEAEQYLIRARQGGIEDERTLGPLGELALRRGDHAAAETLLIQGVKLDRPNPRLWAMLAESQKGLGKDEQAVATLKEAVAACDDQRGRLYLELGKLLHRMDRRAEAAAAMAQAAELLPDDMEVAAWREAIESLDAVDTQPGVQTQPSTAP